MSAPATTDTPAPLPPRSTSAVVGILASLVVLLLVGALLVLLFGGGNEGAGKDVASTARDGRIQAVYMSNDRVFFGTLEASDGDWLKLSDAFFLRRAAATDGKDGETSAGATEVVPAQQEVGGDGNLLLNAREVVMVQNLTADSEISKTIEDATS